MNRPEEKTQRNSLKVLETPKLHAFIRPAKRIHEGQDVSQFLVSSAYSDIGTFITQLNKSMCPRRLDKAGSEQVQAWSMDDHKVEMPDSVQRIQSLLRRIDDIVEEAPPDSAPRRFGNISFRKWYGILESRVSDLLKGTFSDDLLSFGLSSEASAQDELAAYLLGGFGSAQRLDYGTGHELSFLAFLGCLWKLGWFTGGDNTSGDGSLERSIVLGVIEPYLKVVRHLILTYTLEPAGSHGVWGLDDHFFLPYIFGSAQYCPAITNGESMPVEGSRPGAPDPGDITKKNIVDRERKHNMYFSAVGFIDDVKTGPFWEHSPILFDISGIRYGWGKINKGMIKMYNAEVLSKFPVVQHFPFGSLFSWDKDPSATSVPTSVHTASQPLRPPVSGVAGTRMPPLEEGTRAPWAAPSSTTHPLPGALPQRSAMAPTQTPWAATHRSSSEAQQLPTAAPWKPQFSRTIDHEYQTAKEK